jgi:hypothetical protein
MFRWAGGIIALMMEAVLTSETSVYFKEITRRYIPEGYLQTRRCENLNLTERDVIRNNGHC